MKEIDYSKLHLYHVVGCPFSWARCFGMTAGVVLFEVHNEINVAQIAAGLEIRNAMQVVDGVVWVKEMSAEFLQRNFLPSSSINDIRFAINTLIKFFKVLIVENGFCTIDYDILITILDESHAQISQ